MPVVVKMKYSQIVLANEFLFEAEGGVVRQIAGLILVHIERSLVCDHQILAGGGRMFENV
jgi:hypothetical protein